MATKAEQATYRLSVTEFCYHRFGLWAPIVWIKTDLTTYGSQDLDILATSALVAVCKKHPLLRANYTNIEDRELNIPTPDTPYSLPVTHKVVENRAKALDVCLKMSTEYWISETHQMWRCTVMTMPANDTLFFALQFDHAVMDGIATGIFTRDLLLALNGESLGDPLPIPLSHAERIPGNLVL